MYILSDIKRFLNAIPVLSESTVLSDLEIGTTYSYMLIDSNNNPMNYTISSYSKSLNLTGSIPSDGLLSFTGNPMKTSPSHLKGTTYDEVNTTDTYTIVATSGDNIITLTLSFIDPTNISNLKPNILATNYDNLMEGR